MSDAYVPFPYQPTHAHENPDSVAGHRPAVPLVPQVPLAQEPLFDVSLADFGDGEHEGFLLAVLRRGGDEGKRGGTKGGEKWVGRG